MANIQKPSEFKTKALTQSRPPSVESMAVLLAQLKAAYPGQNVTAETAELYLTELAAIHREAGAQRLAEALKAAMRECKFFPTVAELWDHIPPPPQSNAITEEMKELGKRAAEGEKFYGLADLAKETIKSPAVKAMPKARPVAPEIDMDKNRRKLEEQRRKLTEKTEP